MLNTTSRNFLSILTGARSSETPKVLNSTKDDNVFL